MGRSERILCNLSTESFILESREGGKSGQGHVHLASLLAIVVWFKCESLEIPFHPALNFLEHNYMQASYVG